MASERDDQGFFAEGVKLLTGSYDAVMAGGEIQASIRQGFRELGNAFGQAWPDQITVTEPGAVFNPLYSDIAAEKSAHTQTVGRDAEADFPSPSEIANEQPAYTPDRGQSQQHGREM